MSRFDADLVDEVEARLRAAAHDAPPSPRAEEIRAALLEHVGANRMPVPGLAPLALVAGALLLALAVGVGAPAIGSFIGTLLDRGPVPSEDALPPPSSTERIDAEGLPMPTDAPIPTREVPASPSVEPAGVGGDDRENSGSAPPDPASAPPSAAPSEAPVPSPSPSPWPPADPPRPIPTPPPTGPPPGTPGG